jgi:citrate synthase
MRPRRHREQLDSSIHTSSDAAAAGESLLSSAQACALLAVKPATLYSYVSRGLVRCLRPGRGRSRLYVADDVARLATRSAARRGHAPVAAGALRWGEPVLESAITSISDGVLAYRGHRVEALVAAGARFEDVADLLWQRPAGEPWPAPRGRLPRLPDAPPVWRLVSALPRLALADDDRWGRAGAAEIDAARRLIRALASALGDRPSTGTVAERAAAALGLPRAAVRVVDTALVVIADHELNASTFAARVAASAGADLHASLGAALYTVTGPRHGGACDRIDAFLAELPAGTAAVRAAIAARLRRGEGLPGLGHRLYPAGDPRTPLVLAAARAVRPRGRAARRLAAVDALVDAVARLGAELPAVDLGLCAAAAALDAPPGTATALFALGRTAGWVAHVLEQRASTALLRPRARYIGPPVATG